MEVLQFQQCTALPQQYGGRGMYGGGLVELQGVVYWGRGGVSGGRVYRLNQGNGDEKWVEEITYGVEYSAKLAVSKGKLIVVGGLKGAGVDEYIKNVMMWDNEKWVPLEPMKVGCAEPCVVGAVGGGSLLVIGGKGLEENDLRKKLQGRPLDTVQVYDEKTQRWFRGPRLPQASQSISAAVHEDLVFLMGGEDMDKAVWCANISELMVEDCNHDRLHATVWRKLPNVPYCNSSVCIFNGMIIAVGGSEGQRGSRKINSIFAFHPTDRKWQLIGNMPFACSSVDLLVLSGGDLLIADGDSKCVLKLPAKSLAASFPYNEKAIYEEAMTKGYVEISMIRCLILGAAGVGKTHLKHLLLKKPPPEQRTSTGVADNPIRAISYSLAGVNGRDNDNWLAVEDSQAMLSVLEGNISGGVSMTTSLKQLVDTLPTMVINKTAFDGSTGFSCSNSTPSDVPVARNSTQHNNIADIENKLIRHMNQSSGNVFGVKWVQFIDSGGQLQYHDILPLFIQNASVVMFVFKLSEKLSHQPVIEYYGIDGKPVIKPYQSHLSHKQILEQSLKIVNLHNSCPLFIAVGTHKDVKDDCTETLEEKNKQLKDLLEPLQPGINFCYGGKDGNEVIFEVNSKTPQPEDEHIAKLLKMQISMCCKPVKIPISWFALEVLLQASAPDGILSIKDCMTIAKRLFIEGETFSAALYYLVNHNIFLYYSETLPQTVFCNPQVVLNKVTELVKYHHQLRDNPDRNVPIHNSLIRFRDQGLLSLNLLQDEKFKQHYNKSLFTPSDLLNLLIHLHVIVKTNEDEYLMTALLPQLDPAQVSQYVQGGVSLMIKPNDGCIPRGLFCYLVAHLLSQTEPTSWVMCKNRPQPLCLYRNCIKFTQKGRVELITLIDMFLYIEVHVDNVCEKLCTEVKHRVYSGIKAACRMLSYGHVEFEDAFVCMGKTCSLDAPHLATVMHSRSGYVWKCSIMQHEWGSLSDQQLIWMSKTEKINVPCEDKILDENSGFPLSLDSAPVLSDLVDKVAFHIPDKWEAVGLKLYLTKNELAVLRPCTNDLNSHYKTFCKIFEKWKSRSELPYTWRVIIGVLRHQTVNELLLSNTLESWITQKNSITSGRNC